MPNIPPGVNAVLPPQYMIGNPSLPPFFAGLQQPPTAMYGAYGASPVDTLAALQRDAAGIHTLVGAATAAANQQNAAAAAAAAIGSGNQQQPSVSQSAAKSAAVKPRPEGGRRPNEAGCIFAAGRPLKGANYPSWHVVVIITSVVFPRQYFRSLLIAVSFGLYPIHAPA